MRLGRGIEPIQSSMKACKAVASSFASGKLVAVMGSFLGTFDAAFVKHIAAIATSSTIVVEDFGLLVIIGSPQLSGLQTELELFGHAVPYSLPLAFWSQFLIA